MEIRKSLLLLLFSIHYKSRGLIYAWEGNWAHFCYLIVGVNPGNLDTEILEIYIVHNLPLTPLYFGYWFLFLFYLFHGTFSFNIPYIIQLFFYL